MFLITLRALDKSLPDSERAYVGLRRDLKSIGSLKSIAGAAAPAGTRGAAGSDIGTIMIAIPPVAASIAALVKIILDWQIKSSQRSIELKLPDGTTIVTDGLSKEDLKYLITTTMTELEN